MYVFAFCIFRLFAFCKLSPIKKTALRQPFLFSTLHPCNRLMRRRRILGCCLLKMNGIAHLCTHARQIVRFALHSKVKNQYFDPSAAMKKTVAAGSNGNAHTFCSSCHSHINNCFEWFRISLSLAGQAIACIKGWAGLRAWALSQRRDHSGIAPEKLFTRNIDLLD